PTTPTRSGCLATPPVYRSGRRCLRPLGLLRCCNLSVILRKAVRRGTQEMSRKRIALFAGLAVLPVILALWLAGFDVSYQLGNYVVSDNAVVAGDLYQASAPAAGQIADLLLDVGDSVEKGQGVANLMTGAP